MFLGQLRKMGILSTPQQDKIPVATKRKSGQLDFSNLTPLNSDKGTKGFAGYRDPTSSSLKRILRGKKKGKDVDVMDSDVDDDDEDEKDKLADVDDIDIKEENDKFLSPDEALKQDSLAEGVRKIRVRENFHPKKNKKIDLGQLKRQHSAEPLEAPSPAPQNRKASPSATTPTSTDSPSANGEGPSTNIAPASAVPSNVDAENIIGSPFKKQRASLPGLDETTRKLSDELGGPRRESESAILASGGVLSGSSTWPGGHTEPKGPPGDKAKFGSEIKHEETAMEDEEF
jgi:hypothetical protein